MLGLENTMILVNRDRLLAFGFKRKVYVGTFDMHTVDDYHRNYLPIKRAVVLHALLYSSDVTYQIHIRKTKLGNPKTLNKIMTLKKAKWLTKKWF